MKRFLGLASALAVLAITGAVVAADAPPAIVPTPKNSGEWQSRHATYVNAAKRGGIDLLFVGDSITEYWDAEGQDVWQETYKPLKAAQFGIAADKVENILWRLQNGELDPAIKPKVLVLLGGVNNSWGCKREQTESRGTSIAAGIAEIVKTVQAKLPKTKILLLALFPLQDGTSPCVKLANEKIAGLKDGKKVFFLDIGPKLADKDGNLSKELTKDGTHLNEKGYQVWADAMSETLKKMMAEKTTE
jgi:beta-glucosidase